MRNLLKLLLLTFPLIGAGVAFVGWTISTKPAPAQADIAERAVAVRVITATPAALAPTATGFGLITPARSFEAIAQVGGTAEWVNPQLKNGDILPGGATIVRLSTADTTLAIAQARANIRAAEARLAEIAVSESNLQAALQIEEQSLELKQAELARLEQLFSAGTASKVARDGAKSAWLAQRQKVQNLQNSLALLPTQRQVQKEQIAVQEAALKTAELNLARAEITLPFTARVGAVSVEVGQLVRVGQTVAAFDGIDAAEVEAQISASDLQKLFAALGNGGQALALNPSAMGDTLSNLPIGASVRLRLGQQAVTWPGTVDRVSNSIDPKTGTIGVIVRIDNAYRSAEPGSRPPLTRGMFVEARLSAAPLDGILVPRAALRGTQLLVVDTDSRLAMVPVTVALRQGDLALITGGIAPGASIVVSTPVPLVEGLLLAPREDRATMAELAAAGARQ